jgi:hypothetical protein
MTVYHNLSGTTNSSFRIGKGGITIFQGSSQPTGVAGDYWLNTNGEMKYHTGSVWASSGGSGGATRLYKSGAYTAVAGDEIWADSAIAAFTITLPATPSDKDYVYVYDCGNNASANNIIVARNGSTIDGAATDFTLDISTSALGFIYNGTTWELTISIAGAQGIQGIQGLTGDGFTGGSYASGTGIVTFTSNDGLGFVTSDLRGADGADGDGFTGGSYDGGTGIVTFTSDDALGFATDDLRGADGTGWTGGSYDGGTGIVTFTSTDALGFATGDLRGADGADGSNLDWTADQGASNILDTNIVGCSDTFSTDYIIEKTAAFGVHIDGVILKDDQVKTTSILELAADSGVSVDGLNIKDNGLNLSEFSLSNGETSGLRGHLTAAVALVSGDICYVNSSGKMAKADASAASTSRAIGMALETISADANGNFLLLGMMMNTSWSWTAGGAIFLSETTGALTQTAPTTAASITQVMGVATGTTKIWFSPSLDIVEHT